MPLMPPQQNLLLMMPLHTSKSKFILKDIPILGQYLLVYERIAECSVDPESVYDQNIEEQDPEHLIMTYELFYWEFKQKRDLKKFLGYTCQGKWKLL